jgi:hypothetical protein
MAGTRNAAGIARRLLIALAILLVAGIAGSFWTGIRAKSSASTAVVAQAQTITDKSLSLIFKPTDLTEPATGARGTALQSAVTTSVLDTTPFTVVTLWSKDGRILFSTDSGRIGNALPGERDRIKAAIDGAAQTEDIDGAFSVMVPFQLPSGVGNTVAIEMTRSDQPITAAAGPWRTNAVFLLVLLGFVGFLLTRVRRLGDSLATHLSFTGARPTGPMSMSAPPPLLPIAQPRSLNAPTPGLREEAEARRRADDRAKDAEERLSILQDQYRKTLEDLQLTRNMIREFPAPGAPDPRVEERALRAEGRVRTLEGQVQALHAEREKLAREVVEATALAKMPDNEQIERIEQTEQDVIGLRAELEGAHTQLSIAQRELEELRLQSGRTEELQEDLDAAHVEALHAREAAETAQSELVGASTELEDARAELRALRNEEQRAAMLEDELRSAKANLESMTQTHRLELLEREADLEEKVRAVREEFQTQVASVETSYREQLGERESVLADRIVAAEQQVRETADELASSKAALEAASDEVATTREELAREAERHTATAAEFEAMKIELVDAAQSNADVNQRLEELESRRALEVADQEQRAAMLDDELRNARADLQSMTEAHQLELLEREADLEEKVRAVREEFQTQVASVETSYREQLGERESVLADRMMAAEQQARETAEALASSKAALEATSEEAVALEDELRNARANFQSMTEAHQLELLERDTELEEKVRAVREEWQAQVASVETSYREQLGERESVLADRMMAAEQQARETAEQLVTSKAALEAASQEAAAAREQLAREAERHTATAAEFEAMKSELADRQGRFDLAGDQVKLAEEHVDVLSAKLDKTREELAIVREQFTAQMARADELSTALSHADREAQEATRRATDLAAQLADAGQSNTEVNRRLQELEARRALEIADGQGRADLDELLQVTQERLAGQTEKLIHAEDRVHELEREIAATAERTEEIEAELRQQHMAEAIRQIRGDGHEQQPHVVPDGGSNGHVDGLLEDRRSGTPFRTELSRDARKSLSQILGLAQILKHQKDAKEQATLIKQLTSYARRLDHTVSDLVDADQLARGTVELNVKRTDLQALIMRVVDESGIATDHEVRIDAEPLLVSIDQRRTEQILSGLLRSSGDRTSRGKGITIKMTHVDGGAMLLVEDPEPSSDASMSPVVRRFAEVQGGWARVESREGGGSSFRVFLPDGGPNATASDVDDESTDTGGIDVEDMADPPVVVDEPWDPSAEQVLIQELHRLSELNADD